MTGNYEEMGRFASNPRIVVSRDFYRFAAVSIAALTDDFKGWETILRHFLDPLIDLAEQRLILSDPLFARQKDLLLYNELIRPKGVDDVLTVGLQVSCDDYKAILMGPYLLVLRGRHLDPAEAEVVSALA